MGITDNIPESSFGTVNSELTASDPLLLENETTTSMLTSTGIQNPKSRCGEAKFPCCMKGIGATGSESPRGPPWPTPCAGVSLPEASADTPEECQSEQAAWVPILLSNCEAELKELYGHKREQPETRSQLLISSSEE